MSTAFPRWFAFAFLVTAASALDAPRPWPGNAALPVTAERIAALPAVEQPAWRAYWEKSCERSALLPARKPKEYAPARPLDGPPVPAIYSQGLPRNPTAEWYRSPAAHTLADHILTWQTPVGAWTKGGNYTRDHLPTDDENDEFSAGTYDNDSTLDELRAIARTAHGLERPGPVDPRVAVWRAAFLRGLAYILDSQYPNGGFPQVYPLVGGYHDAITFNDDAMLHVLQLLRDVGARQAEFAFVPAADAAKAKAAFAAGIRCILACQLRAPGGSRTIWGQQHDALTLQPCAARNFEPAAECSRESAGLVGLLMQLPAPDADTVAAVDGAMAWFTLRALHDVAWNYRAPAGTGVTSKPGAPALWARFYEFGTGRPIFGERDRMIHYDPAGLSLERRNGYGWFNSLPAELFPLHARWKQAQAAMK
jgi:PelA/Pel-15E family pectate lyase